VSKAGTGKHRIVIVRPDQVAEIAAMKLTLINPVLPFAGPVRNV
jgi:hypothetical protein